MDWKIKTTDLLLNCGNILIYIIYLITDIKALHVQFNIRGGKVKTQYLLEIKIFPYKIQKMNKLFEM